MSLTELNSFGNDFVERVKNNLPQGFSLDGLLVLNTGLVLILNSQEKNQGYLPLGCPECLGFIPEQNSEGYPTIHGKRLLLPEEIHQSTVNISPEMLTNLWLCPNCFVPVSSLIPNFDVSAL